MRKSLLRLWPGFLAALCLIAGGGTIAAHASTPGSGTISWTSTSLDWSGSNLTGTAPAVTRLTCYSQTACDDYALTVDTKKGGSVDPHSLVEVKVAPSSGASMYVIVYPPGSDPSDPTNTDYNKVGLDWKAFNPANGKYTIRVVCQTCAAASYTAHATIVDSSAAAQLPPVGSGQFKWAIQQLPPKDAGGNDVAFGEPGIIYNRQGEGIVNTFGPAVWITKDNGKTWSLPVNLGGQDTTCLGGSGDADGFVAEDGTFYTDNLCLGNPGVVGNDMFTNRAGGDPSKWTGPVLAGADVDRPWITADPQHPGVVYMEYHDLEGPNISVLKSTDYGASFACPLTGLPQLPCPITTTNSNTGFLDTGVGNLSARLLIDPTNTNRLYVPYVDNCAVNSLATPPSAPDFDLVHVHVAVSTDAGQSWVANANPTQAPVFDADTAFGSPGCSTAPPTPPGCDNTVAHTELTGSIDTAGNLYLVFSVRLCNQTDTHLYLLTSKDHGVTWSHPARIDQSGMGSNVFQWVAAGDPGRLAVTWYAANSQDYNDTGAHWAEMYAFSSNALSGSPTFTQSRITTHSIHDADICQAGTFCLVTGGNRNLADFQGVAVDKCGFAQAVWTEDSSGTGFTYVARQTAGPNLFNVNPCAAKVAPFTIGAGFSNSGVLAGAVLAGVGALLLLGLGGLAWRRRQP